MPPSDRPGPIHASVFIAPNATVFGQVSIGQNSSVWFGAVIRGDTERITIGRDCNIQDLCVLHADENVPCRLGDRVTVGHAAIVHGAVIEDDVMIGMRAVVMNHARIGSGSVIAAGAVVVEGMEIPAGSVVMGMPAKIKRAATDDDLQRIRQAAQHYVLTGQKFRLDSPKPEARREPE